MHNYFFVEVCNLYAWATQIKIVNSSKIYHIVIFYVDYTILYNNFRSEAERKIPNILVEI